MSELMRSYNQVSTSLPHHPWRRKLTHLQKCLWHDLIEWPTYCGIYKLDLEERAWYYGTDIAEIECALALFEASGKIKRDGEWVWVVGFIDHQRFNANGLKCAMKELLPLTLRTGLASEHYRKLGGTLPEGSLTFGNVPEPTAKAAEDCPKIAEKIRSDQIRSDQIIPPPKTAEPVGPSEAEQLQQLEDGLGELSQEAWKNIKIAMHNKRVSKRCATSKILSFLQAVVAETQTFSLSDAQIAGGLDACRMANDGPAENGRYFRKAALNYRPPYGPEPEPLPSGSVKLTLEQLQAMDRDKAGT